MKVYHKILLLVVTTIVNCSVSYGKDDNPIKNVDVFIGTDGTGHTYPGATVPFGMVQLSPDTDHGQWKDCSGYHYSDSTIIGFSHTHLSGTGVGDLGDIMLQPATGALKINEGDPKVAFSGYRSRFSHKDEKASPGYYKVLLKDYNIDVELTATERAGMHRYVFHKQDSNHVVLDMSHKVLSEKGETKWAFVQIQNDSTIVGYRLSHGWAAERYIYFALKFSKPFKDPKFFNRQERARIENPIQGSGNDLKAVFYFDMDAQDTLLVKVGISAVSIAGAMNNLNSEIPGWDFDKVRNAAADKWNKELSKITLRADQKTMRTFYSALYHTMLAPTVYMDVDGQYRGVDNQIHKSNAFVNYTTFSLWDTFRALNPLFTIINPDRVDDMINSMLAHYQQNPYKILPIWPLQANETWTMIGYHAAPVIADAYLKGFKGFDANLALEAMIKTANTPYEGIQYYKSLGYVPIDKEIEAASKTLEYAYDDWTIACMAKKMGNDKESDIFFKRSSNYKNVFDTATNFVRARLSNGKFKEPFDPLYMRYGGDYTEGNAWQYSWFVPHDVSGLIHLYGGDKAFSAKLDSLFGLNPTVNEMYGNVPYDVTGLIGQYAQGNEPSHHIAYMYNYANEPWKTQRIVHKIVTETYNDTPDGLCGNEDCGQMSAWFIWSAMGMYPLNPVGGIYQFGSPLIESADIRLENGNVFKINVRNAGKDRKYIKSVKLNGKPYKKMWISHADILNGGELEFEMSAKPAKNCFDKENWEAFEKGIF